MQNARHRLAAKATPGQTAHTAKLKLLDPKKSDEDWAIEGKHEKQQEEDDSWAAQLAKSRRSRFAKTERDELSMEKNTRNNIVFKGAGFPGCMHSDSALLKDGQFAAWGCSEGHPPELGSIPSPSTLVP